MKIKEDLPQFKSAPALLLVSGDQSGVLYFAHKGEIEKIAEFKELVAPKGREGFFGRKLGKAFVGVGSADENKEAKAQERFLKEFTSSVKHAAIARDVSEIYLFSPSYFERTLFEALDDSLKKMIVLGVHGTFIKEHPFTILQKIQELSGEEETSRQHISKEAKKLLEKSDGSTDIENTQAKAEKVRAFMARKKEIDSVLARG